jgi:uncharacterized protein (TIGR02271 family)
MKHRDQLVPFSSMNNYKVSEEDPDVRGWHVVADDGRALGTVRDMLVDTSRMKVEYFSVTDGIDSDALVPAASAQVDRTARRILVPQGALERGTDTSASAGFTETRTSGAYESGPHRDERLTRAEEEVRIGKRDVAAGEVVVAKHVDTERIREDVPVERERVRVERRPVSDAGSADIAEDEIRVPLVEEELVVEKRAVVKEELIISKERIPDVETVDTEVRRERFDIQGDPNLIEDAPTRSRGRK